MQREKKKQIVTDCWIGGRSKRLTFKLTTQTVKI